MGYSTEFRKRGAVVVDLIFDMYPEILTNYDKQTSSNYTMTWPLDIIKVPQQPDGTYFMWCGTLFNNEGC